MQSLRYVHTDYAEGLLYNKRSTDTTTVFTLRLCVLEALHKANVAILVILNFEDPKTAWEHNSWHLRSRIRVIYHPTVGSRPTDWHTGTAEGHSDACELRSRDLLGGGAVSKFILLGAIDLLSRSTTKMCK